jgi:hypothetical protein
MHKALPKQFMKKGKSKLTLADFARLFGTVVKDIPKDCRNLISKSNFSYRKLDESEHNTTMLAILKKIDSEELSAAGESEDGYWEKTWKEILENFVESDYDLTGLVPKYLRRAQCARLYKDYVIPADEKFWVNWFTVFRQWLFRKYLKDMNNIYEFGCGTGQNLVMLSKIFPQKKLYGYDWVKPSVDIINLLAEKHGYNLEGRLFDMFVPDKKLNFPSGSAVLTVHALEQMGSNFEKFLNFIIRKSPDLCINIEPIYELYDAKNPVDHLAIKFHKKRNYLRGYLNRLRQLEKESKIEILKTQRVQFGSLYHDSYSYIVWKIKK